MQQLILVVVGIPLVYLVAGESSFPSTPSQDDTLPALSNTVAEDNHVRFSYSAFVPL
jgi:hypothetical protein